MTDYTARNVLLKDANGNYLIPYTEKADLSLSNLNATGKAYVAIKGYDSNTTYSLNEVVMTVVSGSVLFYKSLANNNTSVLSDTTKWEELEFGGSVDIDGSTITLNSSDELQTVGVIDNRSGSALKLWTGTRSQYDAILSKDANTLYNITDDTGSDSVLANTNLSNLTETGENHFANPALTNSSYTTNRILEIPQNIKLELSNGTLTLKAGSKVYIPNGSGVFNTVTIASDTSFTVIGTANILTFVKSDGTTVNAVAKNCVSGSSQPSLTYWGFWYDTANNIIKLYNGSNWDSGGWSLPLCFATSTSDSVTSIDQIFNGFGYIGSTVFALPGVKVQQATGFDGNTPTSEIQTIHDVIVTQSAGNNNFYDVYMRYTDSGLFNRNAGRLSFDADRNLVIDNDYPSAARGIVLYSYSTDSTGRIKTFNPASTDFVANSNASNFSQAGRSYLSGLGMPSNRYIDLTLLASGQTYTAPANGYFSILGGGNTTPSQANPVSIYMSCGSMTNRTTITVDFSCGLFIPAKKGQSMYLEYRNLKLAGISYAYFRFVYAEGEE